MFSVHFKLIIFKLAKRGIDIFHQKQYVFCGRPQNTPQEIYLVSRTSPYFAEKTLATRLGKKRNFGKNNYRTKRSIP